MAGNQGKILCSVDDIRKYCDDNADKYSVEPIVRKAYRCGLIPVETFYIHLRIAEKKINPRITYKQIADEVGFTPSLISKYKNNSMMGITDKVFVMILLSNYGKELIAVWEKTDFNQALANYVNSCEELIITNDVIKDNVVEVRNQEKKTECKGRYMLTVSKSDINMRKELTKDVCRKIYSEYLSKKVKIVSRSEVERILECGAESVYFISAKETGRKDSMIQVMIHWKNWITQDEVELECCNKELVKNAVERIRQIIGGFNSHGAGNGIMYIMTDKNRKLMRAVEYIALYNKNVVLVKN